MEGGPDCCRAEKRLRVLVAGRPDSDHRRLNNELNIDIIQSQSHSSYAHRPSNERSNSNFNEQNSFYSVNLREVFCLAF